MHDNEIVDESGKTVRRSANLSGILRYPAEARTWVDKVSIERSDRFGGRLSVFYGNGSFGSASFASYSVLCDWLRNRRSWYGARLYRGTEAHGEISRTNPQETPSHASEGTIPEWEATRTDEHLVPCPSISSLTSSVRQGGVK